MITVRSSLISVAASGGGEGSGVLLGVGVEAGGVNGIVGPCGEGGAKV